MTDPVVQERTANFARATGERARTAEELRWRAERFCTLSTAAPIGIYETDARGRCLYTNHRFQEMAGLTLEESLEDGYLRAIHPEDRPRVAEAQRTAAAEGKALSIEFRFLTPTGEARWVRARANVVRSPQGRVAGYVGTMEDVTESRRTEEALRASEERYRMLAEQSSDFIARHRMDGVMTYASPACRSLLGYEPEEMVGESYFELFYPDDVEPVREKIRAAAATEPGIATVSYRVRRKNDSYVWLETALRVLHDPVTQAPSEVLTASRDISERKRLDGMRQDLVAMLSHDLKNLLSAVLGFAEILRDLPPDEPQRDEFLARIEANAHSALSLAMNFVDASQIQAGSLTPRLEPVFLNETIQRVLRHQESRARVRQIRLEVHLDRSGPVALLDPRLIDRVVANLVSNAIQFSPTKSSVRVETAVQNGSVVVRVRDQGPGIPEDQRPKLFQRFNEMGSQRADSSGLGLFIVHALVGAQGGTVGAEFPPEGGAVFEIAFPAGA